MHYTLRELYQGRTWGGTTENMTANRKLMYLHECLPALASYFCANYKYELINAFNLCGSASPQKPHLTLLSP